MTGNEESEVSATDPAPTVKPLRGVRLWLRLVVSVLLSPLVALGMAFDLATQGNPGGEDEAASFAWWWEPFRVLGDRKSR